RVQTAQSAAEALAAHAASGGQPFGLVLSDVVMEPTSGVELARELLRHDANLRLVFMSGEVSPETFRRDFDGRGFDLLLKPFPIEGLLGAVRKALNSEVRSQKSGIRRPQRGDQPGARPGDFFSDS